MAAKIKQKRNNPSLNILRVFSDLKKHFPDYYLNRKPSSLEIIYKVRPTDFSLEYKIKILFNGKNSPKTYVIEPDLKKIVKSPNKVHMYSDYSLCLFYNVKWKEFDVDKDVFSNTIIPWISLWLYYFELWQIDGIWRGGGIHLS